MDDSRISQLAAYDGEDQITTSHEMQIRLMSEKVAEYVNVKSLIPGIDAACEGFRDGELITISGPTKNGKTLLAQTFTHKFSRQGQPPLWFSFEVPARQFLSQFADLPLIYMPCKLKARAMDWFEDRVYESFAKFNTRIIFIDHLHFLVDMAKQGQMSLEIGTIIRKLKTMAVEGNFVIFLLCHTKMGKHDGTLSYESIRDSSFISQESDTVIMVQRKPDIASHAARARIEFHRRTGVVERVVELVKVGNYLEESTTIQEKK